MTLPTSSHSDTDTAHFHKSSYCGELHCVEVAILPGNVVAVRDSKDQESRPLHFAPEEWSAFVLGVTAGEFSLDSLNKGR